MFHNLQAGYIYFGLFDYISVSYSVFLLWDVGTLKWCVSHLLPGPHMPPPMHIFWAGGCQLMLGHFPSLHLCQSPLQLLLAVLEIVYCLGIPDILRAAFIGLLGGRFGRFLGSLHC